MSLRLFLFFVLGLSVPIFSFSQKVIEKVHENDPKFTLGKGDVFVITLESNPSTGYCWQLLDFKDSALVVKIADIRSGSEKKIKQKKKPNANVNVGVAGQERWTFKALKQGTATIKLKYCRPWEPQDTNAVLKTYIVKIR